MDQFVRIQPLNYELHQPHQRTKLQQYKWSFHESNIVNTLHELRYNSIN